MIAPEYIFYCLAITLAIVCVVCVRWWWKDVTITSIAMEIAQIRLRELGINLDSSKDKIAQQLRFYSAHRRDDSGQSVDHRLILASLYLLRGELHLNKTFFKTIAEIPGFESSNSYLDLHTEIDGLRELLLQVPNTQRITIRQRDIEQAAERLNENFLELEQVRPRNRVAA
jgi:hypothetical protein